MNLPSPIRAYFDADKRNDGEALVQAFAPDAVVGDEGHSHAGRHAIGAWWRDAKANISTSSSRSRWARRMAPPKSAPT